MTDIVPYQAPRPNRRGVLFYGSAIVTAAALTRAAGSPAMADPVAHALKAFFDAKEALEKVPDDDDLAEPYCIAYFEAGDALGTIRPKSKEDAEKLIDAVLLYQKGSRIDDRSPLLGLLRNLAAAI